MNSRHMLFAAFAALLIFGFFIFSNSKEKYPTPKNSTVVAFGDSLVQGVGATPGNDFVSLVSRELGISIINKGKSGDTTETALARIDEVLALDPGVVIVLLGGNDYLRKVPKGVTFQNLDTIVSTLQKQGAVVVLLGVRGGLLRDTYDENFEAFAKERNLPFVSNVLDNLIGNDTYMSDSIHPNDLGYAIIAERVADVLEKVLK